jgi:hypothetical protein
MREAVYKKLNSFSRGNDKASPFQPYLYVPLGILSVLVISTTEVLFF